MADQAFSLITLRTYWEDYQQRLLATITPLSSEQLAFPVASHATIGDLLGHMIGARFNWFHLWIGEEEPAALAEWGTDEDMRRAASLVNAFEITWGVISPALGRWTAADLAQVFEPPASHQAWRRNQGLPEEPPRTREWIVWHVLEHEMHHGGELSLTLGGYGLSGIDI